MPINPVPDHLTAVTPALVLSDCAAAIDWYRDVFGAEEILPRMTGPDGTVGHAEIRIGDSTIMLGDAMPDGPTSPPTALGGTTSALFIHSGDAESIWRRAVEAGAEVLFPFELQFYGDKAGRIRDPWGHQWGIAMHVEDVSEEEMQRRMADYYQDDAGER